MLNNDYAVMPMSSQVILKLTEGHAVTKRSDVVDRLVRKWNKATGLLDGLDTIKQRNLAQILENEAFFLKQQILSESTAVSDIAGFNKVAFPLVRRIFAQLLANEIVSVQPISMPSGLVFYLDFVLDRAKPGMPAGSLYGTRETVIDAKSQGIGGQTGQGGFYNFGNVGYSNRIFAVTNAATLPTYASVTAASGHITGTLSGFEFTLQNSNTDLLSKNNLRPALSSELVYDTSSASAFRSGISVAKISADTLNGTYDTTLTQVINASTVRIFCRTNLVAASATAAASPILTGRLNTTVTDGNTPTTLLGDFESVADMPQINMQVKSIIVTADTKKVKSIWTPEMAQDLNAYQSIDAEVELTNIMSEEVAIEIDREIIIDIVGTALVKAAWSRKLGRFVYVDTTGVIRDGSYTISNQVFFGDQRAWNQTFGEVALGVSNNILKRNLRGGANWMVISTDAATIFESTEIFKAIPPGDSAEMKFSAGIEKTGQLMSRFTVYKDPYFPASLCLLGFKGKQSILETGYVWAPYVPLIVTPTIYNPDTFNPIKGVMTRNAKTIIRNDYYGTIQILDLRTWLGL